MTNLIDIMDAAILLTIMAAGASFLAMLAVRSLRRFA
jgi:hypothetical protein